MDGKIAEHELLQAGQVRTPVNWEILAGALREAVPRFVLLKKILFVDALAKRRAW